MKITEAAALLTVCASFDNRKPDREQAQIWALALDDLRFEDCRDAIVAHYQRSRDWIMPFDIRAGVRKIRDKRISDHPPITPPPSLADDPAAQIAWRQEAIRRIGDGEHVDCDAAYGELKPRHLPELRALMPAPDKSNIRPLGDRPSTEEIA